MKYKSCVRVAAVFSLALAIATSLWFASPVMLGYAQVGYGGAGGGGGGAGEQYPGITFLGGMISSSGVLNQDVTTARSPCNLGQLTIYKGTKILSESGAPIFILVMMTMADPPQPPQGFTFVGCVCQCRPEGTTFELPATLTFTYDPALLPEGVDEKNLVIAMYDEETGEWVILDSTVDPDAHTITAQISHFTAFAILAGTAPAAFTVTDLTIVPSEAVIGGRINISALVNNTGYLSGSYEVALKINDVAVATEEVTLPGRASQKVTFVITAKDVAGTYTVDVNGLAGTFEVTAALLPPPPAPAPPAPEPEPPVPPPAQPIDWWFIGITAIAGCIIISVVIWLAVRRRA